MIQSIHQAIFHLENFNRKSINDKIQIPKFISSTPRSVYDYKLLHAHEFLSFFLYFSFPVLHSILPFEFYNNLKKIVIFLEVILSKIIDVKKLDDAQELIEDFVEELGSLYPQNVYSSGVHELLHFVECTKNHGALNSKTVFNMKSSIEN